MNRLRSTSVRRPAFTLIELLVVIALLGFMAAIGVLVVANVNYESGAPRGAVQVQQWLQVSKQMALRDRAPRGVRLSVAVEPDPTDLTNTKTITVCRKLQYIEQPDPFSVQPGVVPDPFNAGQFLPFRRIVTPGTPPTLNLVTLEPPSAAFTGTPADFSGGMGADQTLWPVQVGDYLEISGGLLYRITAVSADGQTLTLASNLPNALPLTADYRVRRAPRVAGGDELDLPDGVAIDLGTNAAYGQQIPTDPLTATVDIVFSPRGEVVSRGIQGDAIYLWVRDTTLPLFQGDNTIVAVYNRSGAVAAHAVDQPPSADPYSFAKDGRASGL